MIEKKYIKIPKKILNEMKQHSQEEYPNESCGYLAGENNTVTDCFRMKNIDQSPEHFTFEPKEQFSVLKKARKEGKKLISVYHSHPETPARLSEEDLNLLNDPNMVYTIVSLKKGWEEIRAFQIKKQEEIITVFSVMIE